jgi:hypothetical protein
MMLARATKWATVAVLTALSATAQSQEAKQAVSPLPRFEDYLVTDIFRGVPAAPQLVTPRERMYRTVIRQGVAKGIGVMCDGKEQAGPNFAGHYIVVVWNCGVPCNMMAVVDARTGSVYPPPLESEPLLFPPLRLPIPGDADHAVPLSPRIEFRQNSSLMTVQANPDPSKARENYTHYFLWRNNHWTLLRRVLMKEVTP